MKQIDLQEIRRARGLKDVRLAMGLSLRELSLLIKPSGSRQWPHVSKALVARWENGSREMLDGQIDQLGLELARRLTAQEGRTIGIRIDANSPWRVSAWAYCCQRRCNKMFELHRFTDRRCKRHRKRTVRK